MRRLLVALVALASLSTSAQAVYTWEDADGLHFTDDPSQVPQRAKVKVLAPRVDPAAPGATPADAAPVDAAPADIAPADIAPADIAPPDAASAGGMNTSPSSPELRAAPASAAEVGLSEVAPPTPVPSVAPTSPAVSPEPGSDGDAPLDERAWRARFVIAQRRVETLRTRATTIEHSRASRADCAPEPLTPAEVSAPGRTVTRCRSSATQERLEARLAEVRGELKEAELELEELDREASALSVPREWRRGW